VFAPGKPCQDCTVLAGAHPGETHFRCSTLGYAPGIAHKLDKAGKACQEQTL